MIWTFRFNALCICPGMFCYFEPTNVRQTLLWVPTVVQKWAEGQSSFREIYPYDTAGWFIAQCKMAVLANSTRAYFCGFELNVSDDIANLCNKVISSTVNLWLRYF